MGMIKPIYNKKAHSRLISDNDSNKDRRSKDERSKSGVIGLTGALNYGPVGKKPHATQMEDFSGVRGRDNVDRVGHLTQNERIELLLKAGKVNADAKAEYFDTTAKEPIFVPSIGLSIRGTKPDLAEAQAIDRANRAELDRIKSEARTDLKKSLSLVRMGFLDPSEVDPEAIEIYNAARKPLDPNSGGAEIDRIVNDELKATNSKDTE